MTETQFSEPCKCLALNPSNYTENMCICKGTVQKNKSYDKRNLFDPTICLSYMNIIWPLPPNHTDTFDRNSNHSQLSMALHFVALEHITTEFYCKKLKLCNCSFHFGNVNSVQFRNQSRKRSVRHISVCSSSCRIFQNRNLWPLESLKLTKIILFSVEKDYYYYYYKIICNGRPAELSTIWQTKSILIDFLKVNETNWRQNQRVGGEDCKLPNK
ncbi:hypothetical protein BpHYR1_017086 [Brachionus plicatilis]|uniref:Uncharacterized protein n=1 Tax=Brachionus plicatilis TaxID=10195 RepID=A0A3M7SAH2_BRAPC|nr:hypothetical protein BpHYR1_017086 [Brachionus plicatilis]